MNVLLINPLRFQVSCGLRTLLRRHSRRKKADIGTVENMAYRKNGRIVHTAANMITSRGCPCTCSFCSKNIFGSKHRARSAPRTVKEIEKLITDYGIREGIFNDDVFTINKRDCLPAHGFPSRLTVKPWAGRARFAMTISIWKK